MKKWWFGPKKHLDEEKAKAKREFKNQLAELLDSGDEEKYIAGIKRLKPAIKQEELERLVNLFREQRKIHPSDLYHND